MLKNVNKSPKVSIISKYQKYFSLHEIYFCKISNEGLFGEAKLQKE